jgi:MFS family permease
MRTRFTRNTKLFLISTLLYGFSFSVWELFFNLYILSLGFSNDTLGLIRSATPISALVLGLPLGLFSDRVGRRASMLIGLSIGFLAMFFQIRLPNPTLIFTFGLFQGIGFMLYRVSQPPFIMGISKKENQVLIFSLNFGLLTIANTIGNLFAGQMPNLLERFLGITSGTAPSYQWVITAGLLLAVTSLIPMFLIRETKSAPKEIHPQLPLKTIIRKLTARPIVRQMAIINVITGFGAAILIPYLNVFLKGKFDIGDDLLGIIFSLSSLLVFLGSMISPRLVRLTKSRVIPTVTTQGASLVFLFALGFSPFLWIAVISLLLRTALMQMSMPLLDNYAMLVSQPDEQGAIASVRGIGWQTGQAIGLFASGFIQTRFGFSPIFFTTGFLYAIAIVLTWVYFRPGEKEMGYAI